MANCDLPIAIVALFVRGSRLHLPPFAFQVSFLSPFRPALCPLNIVLTVFEIQISHFFLLDTTLSSEIEEEPGIFKFPEAAMFVYNSRTRFIARDIARFSRGKFAREYIGNHSSRDQKTLICYLILIIYVNQLPTH